MRRVILFAVAVVGLVVAGGDVDGRGFGGRGFGGGGYRSDYSGGFSGGGYRGSFSGNDSHSYSAGHGSGFSSFSGSDRNGGSYSGSRSTESHSGWDGRSASSSYDRSFTGSRGNTVATSGTRGAAEGRYGGVAAGGTRNSELTTAGGKTYSGERQGGFASGPGGRTVGGGSGSVEGRYGASSWQTAFSGNRYTGNMNHYASVYGANGVHSTAHWSTGYMGTHATAVRGGFGYYGAFHPGWYSAHPGCWAAAGWAAGAAWAAPAYSEVASYCDMPADAPPDYDYGSSVVYQGDSVYVNGEVGGTAQQYADQAATIAAQGQTATPPATGDWKPLGVYALVQGDDKTSNNVFQLAVNKDGIVRGNFYDGLMDTTSEVYGSVDKKTRLAAWTVGKKKDRVFEAGVYNLTQPQCPCLVHTGTQSTNQLMLVRVEQPATPK